MTRSILSAGRFHPVWQPRSVRVEAPDEDAFTLAVSALGLLASQFRREGARRLHRVHVVGAMGTEADWALAEALGIPHLEVRRHPAGFQGLWGALAAAAHDEGPGGREAVVAVEVTDRAHHDLVEAQAGAAAFLLGPDAGLSVLRHGYRASVPGRTPSMKATILSWLEALGVDPSAEGLEVVFQTDEFLARWQKAWEEVVPGAMVSTPDLPAAPAQRGSTLGAASALWELARRLRTRQSGLIAEVGEGRSGYAGFRLDGPVRWRGLWGPLASGVAPPSATFLNRRFELGAVSQGAYVPHARYLENLASRWRLEAERCAHCQALTFPTAGRCTACGHSDGLRPEPLRAEGLTVESVTTISPGAQPTEFDPIVAAAGPYDVVVATVAPGVRATFQVTDAPPGHLRIGDRVRLALRRLYPMDGEWRYGLKAVPDRGPAPTPATRRRRRASGAPRGHRASPRARVAVRRTPRRSAR